MNIIFIGIYGKDIFFNGNILMLDINYKIVLIVDIINSSSELYNLIMNFKISLGGKDIINIVCDVIFIFGKRFYFILYFMFYFINNWFIKY